MSCIAVQNLISEYIVGELTEEDAQVVLAHVDECADCRNDMENSRYLSPLLREHLELPDPPEDFPAAVRTALEG